MDLPSHSELVAAVDAFLERHGIRPSTFGRTVFNDATFVSQLRDGREPGLATMRKLIGFMRGADERLSTANADSAKPGRPHRLSAGAR